MLCVVKMIAGDLLTFVCREENIRSSHVRGEDTLVCGEDNNRRSFHVCVW